MRKNVVLLLSLLMLFLPVSIVGAEVPPVAISDSNVLQEIAVMEGTAALNPVSSNWQDWPNPYSEPVAPDKDWTVCFNLPADIDTLTDDNNIYVSDNAGNRVDVELSPADDRKSVSVIHPEGGYIPNAEYSLYIQGVEANGKTLNSQVHMDFSIANSQSNTGPPENWVLKNPLPEGSTLKDVCRDGSQFVAVGEAGAILNSLDGINWTEQNSGITNDLLGVCWSNNQFVAVGYHGTILSSLDRVNWTEQNAGTTNNLRAVCWSDNQFVAVGDDGIILSSPDGVTWTKQNLGTTDYLYLCGVCWSNSQFVVVGGEWNAPWDRRATILTSPDGINWAEQNLDAESSGFSDVCWNGSQFVAVGNFSINAQSGIIWNSSDGVNWIKQNLEGLQRNSPLNSVCWNGSYFVAVGKDGFILSSPDGVNWTEQSSGTINELNAVYWNGNQFMVVGYSGTILQSQ